jgi:hypothetical protein
MSYLHYLCLFVHIALCSCVCFVCLRIVSCVPMLLVTLDCSFMIAPLVFSSVYSSQF